MVLLACIFMLRADATGYGSQSKPWQVANALLQHRIVLDAILIGEGQENSDVMALVKATNGYAFAPTSMSEALELCELETLLSSDERPVLTPQDWPKPGTQQVLLGAKGSAPPPAFFPLACQSFCEPVRVGCFHATPIVAI